MNSHQPNYISLYEPTFTPDQDADMGGMDADSETSSTKTQHGMEGDTLTAPNHVSFEGLNESNMLTIMPMYPPPAPRKPKRKPDPIPAYAQTPPDLDYDTDIEDFLDSLQLDCPYCKGQIEVDFKFESEE